MCVCVCVCVCVCKLLSDNVRNNSVSCLSVFICVCLCLCLCLCVGVSHNMRICFRICVCVVCGLVCVSRNLCDLVLIYFQKYLLLSWMLTFKWFTVCLSRDLWDRDMQTVNVLALFDDLLFENFYNRRGTVYYKSSLIFTHIGCVCDLVSNYLCGGVSYNMRNFFRVCVCVVCGLVCVSRNLCDLVLNYCRQRLFLSCLMIFSCSIVTNYVQMINQ